MLGSLKKWVQKSFNISNRAAGTWALFSIWLSSLFTITYGQAITAKAAENASAGLIGGGASILPAETIRFQFYDEVGLYVSNATILMSAILILAIYKPKFRFQLMGLSLFGAAAIALGLIEKIVYAKWAGAIDTLPIAEQIRESDAMRLISVDTWSFNPLVVGSLGGMLQVDLALIMASAMWAVAVRAVVRRKHAALETATASA